MFKKTSAQRRSLRGIVAESAHAELLLRRHQEREREALERERVLRSALMFGPWR